MNAIFFPLWAAFAAMGLLVGLVLFAFWIWMIVDCAKRSFRNTLEKVIWLIVIVAGTWIGALVYFIVIKLFNPHGLFKK